MRLLLAALACTALAPAAAAQTAAATVDTPVLSRAVDKGQLLSEADFTLAPLGAGAARGAVAVAEASGMEAARRLQAGAPVRATDIIRPQLVRRGEPVTITVVDGGLRITAQGRALSNGAAGDLVRVVNLSSSRTLDGIVEKAGVVRISGR
jgi:flagella basal body P-ring formation protein FlgA